jgi:hypothetical protein
VIALAYKGRAVDVTQVGRDQRALCARRQPAPRDEIKRAIVVAIDPQIGQAEQRRAARKRP